MKIDVRVESPQSKDVLELLKFHVADAHRVSPPEFAFVLPVEDLRRPEITFWTARKEGELLGFGALKSLGDRSGEIKSMRTAPQHVRQGVAACLLKIIISEAQHRGYTRLYLETGATEDFVAARKLYTSHGFEFCDPFSDYIASTFNRFMSLDLDS